MRRRAMHIALVHNQDFGAPDDPAHAARADVQNVADALARALEKNGHQLSRARLGEAPLSALESLVETRPDVVVNLCESVGGDARGEALVPLALDLAKIPYTGSDGLALASALQKGRTKKLLRVAGVPTPEGGEVSSLAELDALGLPFPLIVKPAREDASVGIDARSVVRDLRALRRVVRSVLERFSQPALVERFIEGRELNVALLGNPLRALPIGEIDFSTLPRALPPIVTYAAKWDAQSIECIGTRPIAAELTPEVAERVSRAAIDAFVALGCRDYGRVDLRLDAQNNPFVIDVNPNCDLSPDAGFARSAARAGIDFPQLAEELVQIARSRHGAASAPGPRPRAAGKAAAAGGHLHAP